MADSITKQAITERVEQSYAAFEAALAALDAAQMTAPALPGGWSVKDALAHLSVWHRRALDIIDPLDPPRVPAIPPSGIPDDQTDTFNARFYAENKDLPLPEALAGFRASYRQLLERVQRMSDADLNAPLDSDASVWEVIAGNTYDHYPEHLEAMQAAFPSA